MLHFQHVSLRRGGNLLLEEITLRIHAGQKVGITGANGSGKSSLFLLLLGELAVDAGELRISGQPTIAHVAQETPAADSASIEYVIDGDRELRRVERALAQAERSADGERQALLHGVLDSIGGYTARSRAARLMNGLGFTSEQEQQTVAALSGGWRVRLNLARALMCRSDLLLLDEPTNHLDLDAVIWLEGWLKSYPGTLLLISHDRDFLDSTITHVAHIEQRRLRLYPGNYSAFERIRAERMAGQQAAYEHQQREVAHIQRYIERFRAKATKARQAQSRIKALERMQQIAPAHVDSPFRFHFAAPEKTPNPLLQLEGARAGYGAEDVLNEVSWNCSPEDRIGLLGHNGAGKSTLIKVLAGELPLRAGHRICAQDLKIGYFAQHQVEQLRAEDSPLQHLQRLATVELEQELRDFLGGFGFSGERAVQPVGPLSGGERSRLALALIVFQRPNLLLLDEPTNHLDLEMRHGLSIALQGFQGAVVLVSHDRNLLRTTSDLLLLVDDGRVEPFAGDLDDYPRWLAENRSNKNGRTESARDREHGMAGRKDRKRQQAVARRRLQPLRERVRSLDAELERLAEEQQRLERLLAAPGLYQAARKADLKAQLIEKAAVDQALARCENDWLAAEEQLAAEEKSVHSS